MDTLLDIIPGYREAVAAERFERDAAFLPVTETVCGLECLAFTPRHFVMLDVASSPFLRGGVPTPCDVAAFFWCVSPSYKPNSVFHRWRVLRKCRRLDYVKAIEAIDDYIRGAFADAPASKGAEGASHYATAAAIVDLLASEYHWTEDAILSTPFKRLFQYLRCVQARRRLKTVMFNPSDRIRGEWLRERNKVTSDN